MGKDTETETEGRRLFKYNKVQRGGSGAIMFVGRAIDPFASQGWLLYSKKVDRIVVATTTSNNNRTRGSR